MPHQRPEAQTVMASRLGLRQLRRVMGVLDKAFAMQQSVRYAKAPDLVSDLEKAMATDQEGDDLESLDAQVQEIAVSRKAYAQGPRRRALRDLTVSIKRVVEEYANSKGFVPISRGHSEGNADELYIEWDMAMVVPGDEPSYASYRLEPRGPDENVLLVDGEHVWRGRSLDGALINEVRRAAAKKFASAHADEERDI